MMGIIGFLVGIVGFLNGQLIHLITETKWEHGIDYINKASREQTRMLFQNVKREIIDQNKRELVAMKTCSVNKIDG